MFIAYYFFCPRSCKRPGSTMRLRDSFAARIRLIDLQKNNINQDHYNRQFYNSSHYLHSPKIVFFKWIQNDKERKSGSLIRWELLYPLDALHVKKFTWKSFCKSSQPVTRGDVFKPRGQSLHLVNPMCTIPISTMKFAFVILVCLLLASCDAGLAPPPPAEIGFSGTVYFTSGSWPPADSLVSLWVFASKNYPLDSAAVFTGLFSAPPTILLYPDMSKSLPFFVDSITYMFPLPLGTYKYVGVIQQTSSDLLTRGIRVFRVVGFFKDPAAPAQPGMVTVNESSPSNGINIQVDFHNPPPPPF